MPRIAVALEAESEWMAAREVQQRFMGMPARETVRSITARAAGRPVILAGIVMISCLFRMTVWP
jgi:hypothetical protein